MNPNRHFGLVSRGLFVGAALFALTPAAIAQSASEDPIKSIPAPEVAEPSGLEAQPQPPQQTTAPLTTRLPTASENTYVPSDETKKLTGRKLVEAPLANLSGLDAAVAEKLRDLIANRGDRFFSNKDERNAAEVFYRDRGFQPLWLTNGKTSDRTAAAIAFLKKVDEDGLEPADYAAPDFSEMDADKLAEAELTYTNEVLDFIRHASSGRVHPSRTFRDTEYKHEGLDPLESLNKIASAANLADTLAGFHPPHEQYKLLKAELAKARGKTEAAPVRIPHGPLIRFNAKKPQEDNRVPLLRERLGLAAKDDKFYDKELMEAVISFQKTSKITSGGIVGPQTVDTMNGVTRDRTEDIILANMERWRWLPRDLGNSHVITSIPGYYVRVVQDRKEVWETRVVVGMATKITPITTQEMSFITVNPTWNVPPSIVARDYIPALRNDPDAMKRMGMRVQTRPDGTLHISQPPGDGNALGRLRFNFPNKFLVYQHDTPLRHLFAHDERAYSAGCIRMQDPLKYAELLMNIARPGEDWTQEKIRKLYGQAEHRLDFKNNIPVHIIYNTAEVRDGKLIIRKDLYKVDAATIKNLKATGNERRQLEVAVRHPDPTPSREAQTLDEFRHQRSTGFDLFGIFRR
ncbi:MAG: L,D-transpeptidase family protein [Rhizobiales bacterium]|jgi:murein L,D-transpeptidase YcbB/YkuD|nr:L,D-transpeptidase family protein [Hyphomicrobiales bacterium]